MKKMTAFLFVTAFFVLNSAHAQNCPSIRVSSPDMLKEGEPAVFTVNTSGGDPNISVTYNWSISAGIIESGQGTSSIYVNTTGFGGQTVTATVELGGLAPACSRTSSSSTAVEALPQTELHNKGDYSTVRSFTDEAIKFAGDFMSAYYAAEQTRAIIYLYPAKTATAAAVIKQMTGIIKKTFAGYGMKPARYIIKTAGKRAKISYEMWIVPKDGKVPKATPVK